MKSLNRLLLVSTVVLFGCQHPAPAPPPVSAMAPTGLHSPWDSAAVKQTDAPFNCGAPIPVGPDITVTGDMETSKSHLSEDVKSAVYSQSGSALLDLTARVVAAADNYRSTGSRAAAQCVLTQLAAAANDRAMTGYMATSDAWLEQNHSLRAFAIAYLKVRDVNTANAVEYGPIIQWMEGLVRSERAYYEHGRCGRNTCYIKNHRGLEVAMAAAAIAIAANDNGLFHWSIGMYHSAIGEITGRGMLHYDDRGKFAFENNLVSAASLVQIAEFAEVNGEPLYGYDNGAIHLLVHTVALGIVSPDIYRVGANKWHQKAPKSVEAWEIAWASVYNRRFPDSVVTSLLQQIGPGGVDMWGGEPWNPEGDPDPDTND